MGDRLLKKIKSGFGMDEDLKRFYELYTRRRSVRRFLDKEIEDEKLKRLFDVLRRAQSAANRQPWHFIVVRRRDHGELFSKVFTRGGFEGASVAIVACAEPGKAWVRKADSRNYAWVDVTIAITEMIGAATAEGIGTCWVAAIDPAEVKRLLCIPGEIEVVGIIAMGYPAEPLRREEKNRKPVEEIIHYGRW